MILPIYTKVSEAKVVSKNKGTVVCPETIPLLRNNFLSEYRTEMEKAKVRKNLGIADSLNLKWENITGRLEESKGLTEYILKFWSYKSDLNSDIQNVKDALDYFVLFIYSFLSEGEAIALLTTDLSLLSKELSELSDTTVKSSNFELTLLELNNSISQKESGLNTTINDSVASLLETITDKESSINSKIDSEISTLSSTVASNLDSAVADISGKIDTINSSIASINEILEELKTNSGVYKSDLENVTSPYTVGGISAGTSIESLKDKSINFILDLMLFPTIVRDLIYPTISYNMSDKLVEVGSTAEKPIASVNKGDAGDLDTLTETVSFNGTLLLEDISTYDLLGVYTYTATQTYKEGDYIKDNKGVESTKRIEAGSVTTSVTINTAYPWYIDGVKLSLIKGSSSTMNVYILQVIKLPGENSKLNKFRVLSGMGFTDVNLEAWTVTKETLNGTTYNVWTKNEPYVQALEHEIQFTL